MRRKPIINSMLDTDLYKLTMMQAVLELFPTANVTYRFSNRGDHRFNEEFLSELKQQIEYMSQLSLSDNEYSWIKNTIPFFKPDYVEYLKNYHFNPSEVSCKLSANKDLEIEISGLWHRTILWEVPLMAIISELYFSLIDKMWYGESVFNNLIISKQYDLASGKARLLNEAGCVYADFGTRRRRSYVSQDTIIKAFVERREPSGCIGTSNIHFAMKYGIKPIGTMAHEWFMGISVLESLRHANFYALQDWIRIYNADLGIALTDTYGTKYFWGNFNKRLAKLYDGIRHDSGDPFLFADSAILHYQELGIDPLSKTIVFSDSLDTQKAIKIQEYCKNKIKCSFGIGTHFTNHYKDSPALNIVIKLWSCEGIPVVKLSDSTGKTMGDPDAVRIAKWIFGDKGLNEDIIQITQRIQNCWSHDSDGSQLKNKKYITHLFSLVFNDLPKAILGSGTYRTQYLPHEKNDVEREDKSNRKRGSNRI